MSWKPLLAWGLPLAVVAHLLGPLAQGLTRLTFAVLLIVIGLRRFPGMPRRPPHPWRIIGHGVMVSMAAAFVRVGHGLATDDSYAFPSPADLVAFAGYGLLILAGVRLGQARTAGHSREDRIDAAIAAVLAGLLIYTFVLDDYLADASVPVLERLTNLGYLACVVVLVGVAARVSFTAGDRGPAYYLLGGATAAIVANGTLISVDLAGRADTGAVAALVANVAFVLGAAAAAHPGAPELTRRRAAPTARLTQRRMLLLFAALIEGPALLALLDSEARELDIAVTMMGAGLLAMFVLVRMVLLVRSRDAQVDQEQALRDLGSQLVTAGHRQDVFQATFSVAQQMLRPFIGMRLSLYELDADGRLVAAICIGDGSSALRGRIVDFADLPADIAAVAHGGDAVLLDTPGFEPLSSDPRMVSVAAAPVVTPHDPARLLLLTSSRALGRPELAIMSSIAGQVSLALSSLDRSEQQHIERSNQRFRALVENSSDVVLVLDDHSHVAFVSPTVQRLLGRPEDQVMRRPVFDIVYRPDQVHLRRLLSAPGGIGGGQGAIEIRLRHGSGELRWFELEASDLTSDLEVGGVVITASDISDRKRAEAELQRSEARFRLMVQNSNDVVAIVDDAGIISYITPSVERMLGFVPAELLGRDVFGLLSVTEAERLRSVATSTLDGSMVEVRVQGADGGIRAVEVAVTDMRDQAEVGGVVLNIRDVTERKQLEDNLRHQALHDDLTGLANRVQFAERVREAIGEAGDAVPGVAVLFIDLDDFKLINDSLGHVVGDQVLMAVADRIQQCLRLSDLAARLGGDEFSVLLTGVTDESEILEVADRLRAAISRPLKMGNHEFPISASVGVATGTESSAEDLLRGADLAMYQAKQDGKDRHVVFEDHMETTAVEELELKSALVRAIENEEFVLHYQPIIDMSSSGVRGVEALIRWEDPERGMVSPGAFIPMAEETGLIRELGMWVVRQAASDLARWQALGHDLYCSVNVSGRQLEEDSFADQLIAAVVASGCKPGSLVIELTESVLAVQGTSEVLDRLHDEGFRVALDDFGTGFSALQYLQSFQIDLIKIDRSFVVAMGETKDTGVVKAVLDVAHSIDALTVAEGIEEAHELAMLVELGVELGQGYFFSKPVPEAKLMELLTSAAFADAVPVS